MSYRKTMSQLDGEQLQAVTVRKNAVVAAGAGSGKTKVLAARYAHLIIERGLSCDEILTLTFTRKAVTEMYSRIYTTLSESSEESANAKKAVSEFHKAKIFTIDSYSQAVARLASRRYGIAPDFVTDNNAAEELAKTAAIPFVLEHRRNPALQMLLVDNKIEDIAEEVFAKPIIANAPISRPIDFDEMLKNQAAEAARSWEKSAYKINDSLKAIAEALLSGSKSKSETLKTLATLFENGIPCVPDERDIAAYFDSVRAAGTRREASHEAAEQSHNPRAARADMFDAFYDGDAAGDAHDAFKRGEASGAFDASGASDGDDSSHTKNVLCDVAAFCRFAYEVSAVRTSSAKDETLVLVFEHLRTLKADYAMLASIGNFCCRFKYLCALFPLLSKFQTQILEQKRVSGVLSFTDVATLAVDALSEHSDIRQAEKRAIKAIMIDEFQDDNELQRDLLFLLAEKAERTEKGIPRADELCPDKLFFVGDEKQSIYRFRGADVSVFRKLSEELKRTETDDVVYESPRFTDIGSARDALAAKEKSLNLMTNYRSHPALICAFNTIFGGFALPVTEADATKVPPRYVAFASCEDTTAKENCPNGEQFPKAAQEPHGELGTATEQGAVDASTNAADAFFDDALHQTDTAPQKSVPPQTAPHLESEPANTPVFLYPKSGTPLFEAQYSWVKPCVLKNDSLFDMPRVTLCSFDKSENKQKTPDSFSNVELEAVFVAQKIRTLVQSGYPVRIRKSDGSAGERPCTYDDITILFRATSHQHLFERQLRAQNVPYAAENVTSFFNDAPINDLYNFLRLVVYPADTNAYASVLCSPFVRLGKNGMLQCLLRNTSPFEPSVASLLSQEERAHYTKGAELYKNLCAAANEQSIAALVNLLWYEYGYRYETMHSENVRMYGELYDYLFELARKADADGETLATFLDTICNQMKEGKKLDDIDIPMERSGGVHLMTIHKSKGLEFPIVFLVDSASGNTKNQNRGLVFIDKESDFGTKGGINLALNLPDEPSIPAKSGKKNGNFIFNRQELSDRAKSCAELRRLLYVALTRAESAVFITGSEEGKNEEEPKEEIPFPKTLFALLKPALPLSESPIFAYEEIPIYARSEVLSLASRAPLTVDATERAAVVFDTIEATELPFIAKKYVQASSHELTQEQIDSLGLRAQPKAARPATGNVQAAVLSGQSCDLTEVGGARDTGNAQAADEGLQPIGGDTQNGGCVYGGDVNANTDGAAQNDARGTTVDLTAIDSYIATHPLQITFADFGTIVHCYMEGALKGQVPSIPAKILAELPDSVRTALLDAAQKLSQNFLHSTLGKKAQNASWARSEYSFKCKIGERLINGQIDLIFTDAGGVTIVDFKTDATEDVSAHIAQLAVYSFAAKALKGVEPACLLYYARSGNAVDVTRHVAEIDVASLLVRK